MSDRQEELASAQASAEPDPGSRRQLIRQVCLYLEALQEQGVWGLPGVMSQAAARPQGRTHEVSAPRAAEANPSADVQPAEASAPAPGASLRGDRQGAPQADLFASESPSELEALRGRSETLEDICQEALACRACRLCERRTHVVFGVGASDARLMFIGEGPGRDEDRLGEPFVGRAGQLLNRIIQAMHLERDQVYIANAVKCRPPDNRNPEADELDACRPFLMRQIAAVQPEIIVLLGRVASQSVLGTRAPLGKLRGRFMEWNGIPVLCTYHPAYLLRNPADKRKTWEDMQLVMERLSRAGS